MTRKKMDLLGNCIFICSAIAALLCAPIPGVHAAQDEGASARPVGSTPTSARAPSGEFISWREHIIDDTAISGVAISGSDGLSMADLDLDGHLDIVSVHESDTTYDGVADGHIRIAFGSGDANRWTLTTLAEGPEAGAAEDVAIGDVNGDGYLDIIAACELAHLIYFQNPGKNIRTARWERTILDVTKDRGSYIRVFLGDFDGDGRLEAVAPNKGEQNPDNRTEDRNPISLYALRGDPLDGGAWVEIELGRYLIPQNSQPVDLDGDGDLDIIGGSRGEGRIMWFENGGGSGFDFTEHAIDIDGGRGAGFNMDYADLNNDGRLDIVLGVTGGLGWIEQPASPSGAWKLHRIGTFGPDSMTGIALADVNGDGSLDVICGSYSRGRRDKDGDVTRDDGLGRLGWFENPGDASKGWTRHDISRRVRGMFDKFVARDFDGDGDMDFAGTRGNSHPYDGVFWLEQVRTREPVAAFERAREEDSKEMPLPGLR